MNDDIALGLKTITDATTLVKDLSKEIDALKGSLSDVALKTKVLELKEKVLNQRESLNTLREIYNKLGEKISDLEDKLKMKETIEFKDPFFYKPGDPNPLCPRCYQDKVNLVYLIKKSWGDYWGGFQCPVCKEKYDKAKK